MPLFRDLSKKKLIFWQFHEQFSHQFTSNKVAVKMFEEFLAIKTIDYLVYVIFPSWIWNLRILGSICQLWGAGNNRLSSKLDILITVCLKVNWRDFEWTRNDAILVWSWAHTLILMWVVQPASLLFRAVVVFLIDKMVVVINVLFFETDFSKKSGRSAGRRRHDDQKLSSIFRQMNVFIHDHHC